MAEDIVLGCAELAEDSKDPQVITYTSTNPLVGNQQRIERSRSVYAGFDALRKAIEEGPGKFPEEPKKIEHHDPTETIEIRPTPEGQKAIDNLNAKIERGEKVPVIDHFTGKTLYTINDDKDTLARGQKMIEEANKISYPKDAILSDDLVAQLLQTKFTMSAKEAKAFEKALNRHDKAYKKSLLARLLTKLKSLLS